MTEIPTLQLHYFDAFVANVASDINKRKNSYPNFREECLQNIRVGNQDIFELDHRLTVGQQLQIVSDMCRKLAASLAVSISSEFGYL